MPETVSLPDDPRGAPTDMLRPIDGPAAWFGRDMARQAERWMHVLTAAELDDLDAAVAGFAARDAEIATMRREDFPLPVFGPVLARMRDELLTGRGFQMIRALPLDRWTVREAAIAYFGIGMHLGNAMPQNAKGHVLGHVKDLGHDYDNPLHRGYQTRARLPYHCDGSDLVGLLCLKPSKVGGLSSIASSVTIWNEMLKRRPDLAALLTRPVYRDRRGEIPAKQGPWYAIPVFNPFPGGIATTYVRSAVRKAQRFPEVPRITSELEEAFDLLDKLAVDPDIHLDMEFRPGDIQFLNNHVTLHSRTAFEDFPEPERRRHLMRLWLACPGAPPLPAVYRNYQGFTEDGRPDGIHVPGVPLNAPLDAE